MATNTTLSNLYVERASSEHPLALWMLNEEVDYVTQITDAQRNFYNSSNWDTVNGTAVDASSIAGSPVTPIADSSISKIAGSVPTTPTQDITLTSEFNIAQAGLVQDLSNINLGFYIYPSTSLANSVTFGYTYLDSFSNDQEELYTVLVKDSDRLNWKFFSHTFDLPPTTATNIKLVIKINVNQGGGSQDYNLFASGLSFGQWSEDFNKSLYGVTPTNIPSNINLPSAANFKVLPAFPYGASGNSAYYLSRGNVLFCKNFGIPLVYGSYNVTKLSPNVYNGVNYPSLIFPGYGFLNERGRHNEYTVEMWIKANAAATAPRKIFGPIASTDGLYADHAHLSFKLGDQVGSHFVGEWYRPMMIHIRLLTDSLIVLLNGEEIINLSFDQNTITLPPEISSTKNQDWLGFYAYEDIDPIDIDTFAIYPYGMPTEVAKRHWVWGQAVTAPEQTNSSINAITVFNDYAFANYSANYNYPDFANWKQAFFSNVDAGSKTLSLPDYQLPEFSLGINTVTSLYSDIKEIEPTVGDSDDTAGIKYLTLKPNNTWSSDSDFVYFEKLAILNDPVETIYGIFKTDGTETSAPLFKITNKFNNDYLLASITGTTVTYKINLSGTNTTLATKTIETGKRFAAGFNIERLISGQTVDIARFFTDKTTLDVFLAGDGSKKFSGRIYKFGFDAAYNSRKNSWMYGDDGIALVPTECTITDVVSGGRMFGGSPTSVKITELDINTPTSISYRVEGGLAPVAGQVTSAKTIPKDSLYVAVATGQTSTTAYSTDGINWLTSFIPGGTKDYRSVVYGNGKFVTVGTTTTAAYSEDGINWTGSSMPSSSSWNSVVYGNGKFVAMGNGSNNTGAYSTDGITWTSFSCPQPGPAALAYGGGRFVAIFLSASTGQYSDDGINWTQFNMPSGASWDTVVYGNDRFVAISRGTPAAYSLDGINWTGSSMPSSGTWNSLTFGDGKFVAVKQNSRDAAYSTDGITWTASTLPVSPFNPSWTTVTYGGGKFVALSTTTYSDAISRIAAYSEDGINWTLSLAPLRTWSSVTHGTPTESFITFGTTAIVTEVTQVGSTQVWDAKLTNLNAEQVLKLRIQDSITATPGTNGKITFTTSQPHGYIIGNYVNTTEIVSSPTTQFNFNNQKIVEVTSNTFTIDGSATARYISGGKARINLDTVYNHTANYTLTTINEYGLLFPDIAVAGYWEDYMPLSYFSKAVLDYEGNENYELDSIQFNVDFPEPPTSQSNETTAVWTYEDLLDEYSEPALLSYENLDNSYYTGWENYEDMSGNTITTKFYNTDEDILRSYVSFQRIFDGANKNLVDFSNYHRPLISGILDPDNIHSLDWKNTAYEVTTGTIIYPPKQTYSGSPIDFNNYAIVYHLDFVSNGIIHYPIKVRELQLASQVLERTDFTLVGSKFGVPAYCYSRSGLYFDLKGKNPIVTYKKSTPHLYLNRQSGWAIKGEFTPTTDRGLSILVNQPKAEQTQIGSVQMWIRFYQDTFPVGPIMVFSINHKNGIYDFFLESDSSQKRGFVFAVDRESSNIVDTLNYYINGQSVNTPFLINEEWTVLSVEFPSLLDFSEMSGTINLNGPLMYNNISYTLATNIEKTEFLETRTWGSIEELGTWDYLENTWQTIDAIWQDVKLISQSQIYNINSKATYERYTGSNRIVIDDEFNGLLVSPEKLTAYKEVSWANVVKVPA